MKKTTVILCILWDGSCGYLQDDESDPVKITNQLEKARPFPFFVAADQTGFHLRNRRKIKLYSLLRVDEGRPVSLSQ